MKPVEPTDIATAPWWRWQTGLTVVEPVTGTRSLCVMSELGAPEVLMYESVQGFPEGGLPDLADPFLPRWLLLLLWERTAPLSRRIPWLSEEVPPLRGQQWAVWYPEPPLGWIACARGVTEIDALVAALQGLTKTPT